MKPRVRWTALAGVLGALLAGSSPAGAEEETIAVKELPRAVREAVKAEFPRARIEQASREEEDGETVYEVTLKQGDRTIDVALEADGEILEIERTLAVDELPSAVKKALKARYPHAAIAKVETVRKGKNGPERFEIAIVTEVVLDAKGKVVKAGEDDEEGDDEEEHEGKAKAKKSSKHEDKDDDDDDDEDEDEHHAKAKAKRSSKQQDRDDDDEEDDDEEEEHERGRRD